MKYLISCAALIVATSGTNLAIAEDNSGRQGAGEAVQHRVMEEVFFSGSGFSSQSENYAPQGHEFSAEEYLFFSGNGFAS